MSEDALLSLTTTSQIIGYTSVGTIYIMACAAGIITSDYKEIKYRCPRQRS